MSKRSNISVSMNELPDNAVPTEYAGYYVTPEGDVWADKQNGVHKLKRRKHNRGYAQVNCYEKGGKRSYPLVHRLVAEAFIPNPDGKPDVNHKNGNKQDCTVGNLEWCTKKENMEHAAKVLNKFERAKYLDLALELRADGWTYREIGGLVGVNPSAVFRAVSRVQA